MMKDPLVSVIVPVYNVEKFLPDCMGSILQQSYPYLEILLVDDGSPDGCPALCDGYAASDERVQVIHQPNGGLSAARNTGLDHCTGEYIAFVDSDDLLHPRYIELLLRACQQENASAAVAQLIPISHDAGPEVCRTALPALQTRVISGRQANLMLYDMSSWTRITTATWKLYHRSVWDGIRFPPVAIHEDEALTYRLLYGMERIVLCDIPIGFYRSNPDSLMGKGFSERRLVIFSILEERARFYQAHNDPELVCKTFQREFYLASLYYRTASGTAPGSGLARQLRAQQTKSYRSLCRCRPGVLRSVKYFMMFHTPGLCARIFRQGH